LDTRWKKEEVRDVRAAGVTIIGEACSIKGREGERVSECGRWWNTN
jgi:hypothetical protein